MYGGCESRSPLTACGHCIDWLCLSAKPSEVSAVASLLGWVPACVAGTPIEPPSCCVRLDSWVRSATLRLRNEAAECANRRSAVLPCAARLSARSATQCLSCLMRRGVCSFAHHHPSPGRAVCVILYFLSRYMRPEGPWQRRSRCRSGRW